MVMSNRVLEIREIPLPEYIENKIKILGQMGHRLTEAQKAHVRELKSEIAVDNFAHSIICKEDW